MNSEIYHKEIVNHLKESFTKLRKLDVCDEKFAVGMECFMSNIKYITEIKIPSFLGEKPEGENYNTFIRMCCELHNQIDWLNQWVTFHSKGKTIRCIDNINNSIFELKKCAEVLADTAGNTIDVYYQELSSKSN